MSMTKNVNPNQSPVSRATRVSFVNGWTIVALSLASVVLGLSASDVPGVVLGAICAVIGGVEVAGGRMLLDGNTKGFRVLIGAQLSLMVMLVSYSIGAFAAVGPDHVVARIPISVIRRLINSGMAPTDALAYLCILLKIAYASIAIVALMYQGAMAAFYRRQFLRASVA